MSRWLLALALALGAAPATASEPVDLVGTWHVLVHYTDSSAADTEVLRWDDRIWVFKRKGSRLSWTEYPIVVFNDRSGRFETSNHGQQRVLHEVIQFAVGEAARHRQVVDAALRLRSRARVRPPVCLVYREGCYARLVGEKSLDTVAVMRVEVDVGVPERQQHA